MISMQALLGLLSLHNRYFRGAQAGFGVHEGEPRDVQGEGKKSACCAGYAYGLLVSKIYFL